MGRARPNVLLLLLQGPLRERRAPARGITPRCESSRGAGPRVPSNFSMEVVATTFTAVKNGDVLLLKHLPVVPCGAFERLSIADPKSLPAAWGRQLAPRLDRVCVSGLAPISALFQIHTACVRRGPVTTHQNVTGHTLARTSAHVLRERARMHANTQTRNCVCVILFRARSCSRWPHDVSRLSQMTWSCKKSIASKLFCF